MALLVKARLSAMIALAACLILLLLSNIFTNHVVSVNTQPVFDEHAAVPAAWVKPEFEAPVTKVAVSFGNKATSHPVFRRNELTAAWGVGAKAQGLLQMTRLKGARWESMYTKLTDMTSPADTPEGFGNGWTVEEDEEESKVPDGFDEPFEDLGIPTGPENHYRTARQNLKFRNCNANNLDRTNGIFISYINVQGGTIVAEGSYSPAYNIAKAIPGWKARLPNVSRMSDVLWIQWASVAEQEGTPEKLGQLKYIFRHDVATPNTRYIIEQAAADKEGNPIEAGELELDWPGYTFAAGDERFMALLGTVHGISVVDLLISHVNELGSKSIASVTIFTTYSDLGNGNAYNMIWTLTD